MNLENFEIQYECENPEKYTTELKMLKERLYYKFYPVKSFFSTKYSDLTFEYDKLVKRYKDNINKLAKPMQAKIEKELINIDCQVTDGNDTKQFSEQLISDNAINAMKNYYEIGRYNLCAKNSSYMLQDNKNKMLVSDILANAKDLLIAMPINTNTNEFLTNCIQKLNALLPIKSSFYEGIFCEEFAYKLDELSKQQVKQLKLLNKQIQEKTEEHTIEE